jgi:hypothetical protein
MATAYDVELLGQTLGRSFVDAAIAKRALTSAGADETDLDGNRTYASWGRPLLELYVLSRRGHQRRSKGKIYETTQTCMPKSDFLCSIYPSRLR